MGELAQSVPPGAADVVGDQDGALADPGFGDADARHTVAGHQRVHDGGPRGQDPGPDRLDQVPFDGLVRGLMLEDVHRFRDPCPRQHEIDPRVRERGVLMCEKLLLAGGPNDELLSELGGFWKESDPRVRLQLAFTLGEFHAPQLLQIDGGIVHEKHGDLTMALIHNSDNEPWIRAAVFSGCKDRTALVFNWLTFRKTAEKVEDQKALLEAIQMIDFVPTVITDGNVAGRFTDATAGAALPWPAWSYRRQS